MGKLQVLVTTMNAKDFAKFYEMNLQTDSVIANQSDNDFISEEVLNGCNVKLVTTSTRGTSKNRNIAIANINNDIEYVMFSDDDLRFYDNYENIVMKTFLEHQEADAIKFNLQTVSERKISMKPIKKFHKTSRREVTSWGVWGLAIKASVLRDKELYFNERFGPGTENYCGEDTIFLQELFKKKIKMYASPEYIAEINQDDSCWFEGFTERYFINAGMLISETYPVLCYLLIVRSAYKFWRRKASKMGFFRILKCYYMGIRKNRKFHKKMN